MDAGLFGPDSVAWRLHADPSMLVGAMRALLVQALEPRAMAGVVQHSDYKADPWGRLNRTIRFVLHTTYGDTRTAEAACAAVRRIHDRVHGVVRVAELLGLPSAMAPRSLGELREYLRGVDGLQLTPGARESMRLIMAPPMPLPLRPLW